MATSYQAGDGRLHPLGLPALARPQAGGAGEEAGAAGNPFGYAIRHHVDMRSDGGAGEVHAANPLDQRSSK
jgi:hypothetical protein